MTFLLYVLIVMFSGSFSIQRSMSAISGSVESTIRSKLQTALDAKHLDIINESYMHNVPKGAETHFKVVVVSEKFNDLPLIKVISISTYIIIKIRTIPVLT